MKIFFKLLCYLFIVCLISFCTTEQGSLDSFTDAEMISLISQATTYYQNNRNLIKPNGNSPHGDFTLLFNSQAVASLGADGKLPKGGTFQEGSVIFKNDMTKKKIVLMYKKPENLLANKGWLWAEYNSDSSDFISVNTRGNVCVSCHTGGEGAQRDYTRIFEF